MKNRRWTSLMLCGGVVLVTIASLFGYQCIHISLEAERTLHAYDEVIDALKVYLRDNSGRWPKSWDDLARVNTATTNYFLVWPRDRAKIQGRVFVDFSVTGAEVGKMSPDAFSVVKPVGPNYGPSERRIAELIEIARRESEESLDEDAR